MCDMHRRVRSLEVFMYPAVLTNERKLVVERDAHMH
jgi:hypothetical protein